MRANAHPAPPPLSASWCTGAGNLFGTEQKGVSAVGQVGLDLYLEILQKAMVYLQRQKQGSAPLTLEEQEKLKEELGLDENTLLGLSNTLS